MYKDPTEFRARFKAYKEGKMPYENGLPKFHDGTSGLSPDEAFVASMGPLLYRELLYQGVENPDSVYNNLITQLGYESNRGRSRVAREQHNYGGVGWNGKRYFSYKNDADFVHDYVKLMNRRYKNAILAKTLSEYAAGIKKLGYFEDTLENYSRNLIGMKSLAKAVAKHKAANPDLYKIDIQRPVSEPIINPVDNTKVVNTIPAEQTHTTWEGALDVSPFITGKPMLRPIHRVQLPNLIDVIEDDLWEPGFPGLKNGKLPCFEMGTPEGVDMGEKRSTPISIEQVRNTPHEQGMSGTDPIGKFVVESVGMTKGAKILGDILSAARLRRMADTYRNLRKYDQDVLNYTGKSLRKLNIQFADKIARDGFLYSRPENPLYWILDPIMAGYTKLQSHPVIGPLIPFKNGKIPEYKNGKSPIHIKPANRGKLTRLKARTGKSESELYNDGNPAHKKMVVFARNARKWSHK